MPNGGGGGFFYKKFFLAYITVTVITGIRVYQIVVERGPHD